MGACPYFLQIFFQMVKKTTKFVPIFCRFFPIFKKYINIYFDLPLFFADFFRSAPNFCRILRIFFAKGNTVLAPNSDLISYLVENLHSGRCAQWA